MTFDNEAVFEAALINLLTEKYGRFHCSSSIF